MVFNSYIVHMAVPIVHITTAPLGPTFATPRAATSQPLGCLSGPPRRKWRGGGDHVNPVFTEIFGDYVSHQ